MASNRKRCDAEQSRSTGRREKEYRPPGLYSKGTGRNACRYLRLGDRRGRAENQPLLLGGVGLGRVATSIQAGQAFPPTPFKYRPGGLYLLACRYLCTFTRNAPEGGEWGENRYLLPNKANKSFRINKSSSGKVKKAPESQPKLLIEGLCNGF